MNLDIGYETFKSYFLNIYKITSIAKLQSFQYRLLHYAIVTNKLLFKWKILDTPFCNFCDNNKVEDIVHLLYNCPYITKLWVQVKTWLGTLNIKLHKFTLPEIIFNNVKEDATDIINMIILTSKQYIYRARCFRNKPTIQGIINEVRMLEKMELLMAKDNKELARVSKKWNKLK